MFVALGVAGAACSDDDGGDSADGGNQTTQTQAATLVNEGSVAATELAAGDCFDGLVIGLNERIAVDSVHVVDCAGEHGLEVFTTFEITAEVLGGTDTSAYPGRARVIRIAEKGCNERIDELEVETAALGALSIWPTTDSWGRGDRFVACVLYRTDGAPFEGRQVVITGPNSTSAEPVGTTPTP